MKAIGPANANNKDACARGNVKHALSCRTQRAVRRSRADGLGGTQRPWACHTRCIPGLCRATSSDISSERSSNGERQEIVVDQYVQVQLGPGESLVYVNDFDLEGYLMTVSVIQSTSQEGELSKRIVLTSNHPGNLLLHWGVITTKKSGWFLPDRKAVPSGTQNYKKRALQTPWNSSRNLQGKEQTLTIDFRNGDQFAFLDFVVKDTSRNEWFNDDGDNFHIPLTLEAIVGRRERSFNDNGSDSGSSKSQKQQPQRKKVKDIPDLPSDLCGIWAYIKWEVAGCPERSQEAADQEYKRGIAELKYFLSEGYSLDELWKVAKGEVKLNDFYQQAKAPSKSKENQSFKSQHIPMEMLNIQAYIIWEKKGKPNGADFGPEARKIIESKLQSGMTLNEIERELKEPSQPESPVSDGGSTVSMDKIAAEPEITESVHREAPVNIPEELLAIQAYVLWEKAGKPDNVDFADAARAEIMNLLETGMSLVDIEMKLKEPPTKKVEPSGRKQTHQTEEVQSVEEEEEVVHDISLGEVMTKSNKHDVLQWIKPKDAKVPDLTRDLSQKKDSPLKDLIEAATASSGVLWKRTFQLGNQRSLLAVVREESESITVSLTTDVADKIDLHWGVCKKKRSGWKLPDKSIWPSNTVSCGDGLAVDTTFGEYRAPQKVPLQQLSICIPKSQTLFGLTFVLKSADETMWWKDGDRNFIVPFPGSQNQENVEVQDPLLQEIIDCENADQWTLMHRCNKANELIRDVLSGNYGEDRVQAFQTLYIWLRYSSIRQLTWQRNYNTQPRILSGAQEGLTNRLAEAYKSTAGESQQWVRGMLGCIGKGGNGQKIRDDILHIMHRHKIKEVKGTWMEEWHQKLHNNTTPDDVAICEAYIEFLKGNGDNAAYWRVLSEAGITRQRLEGFDRAIRCEPEDFPDKRSGLIDDFRDYLRVLKSVHSGTDLQTAVAAVSDKLPSEARGFIGYVLSNKGNEILPYIQSAVEARISLQPALGDNRDFLYLDLALETSIRAAAERGAGLSGLKAGALVEPLLQNLCLSFGDNTELCYCLKAWQGLPRAILVGQRPNKEEALLATAVVERLRRALGDISDSVNQNLQPIAEAMGLSLGCERWTIELFGEEVIRGSPAFAVSLVLSSFEPILREAAELGAWQVVSPVDVSGLVETVDFLYKVQNKVFDEPTVLIAERVTGEEEIPENCVAVLTPDAPDMLSHISVRARNEKVLLATCHNADELKTLMTHAGHYLAVSCTASGSVSYSEVEKSFVSSSSNGGQSHFGKMMKISTPKWVGKYVVGMDSFQDMVVGAKSKNLAGLRDKVPTWINLPASITIPFGTFEKILEDKSNKEVSMAISKAAKKVAEDPEEYLELCKEAAMSITVPDAMWEELTCQMKSSDIQWNLEQKSDKEMILNAIKSVWASKFNLRAYYSLHKARLDFMDVRMAVLIQKVVNAKYAFVIHTTNPSTGNMNEIYAEVVKGLGEVLVGNYPGRALSFVVDKHDMSKPVIESFPSKSVGLYLPESLMFRSDSNGEDLDGYAGAGLYDSVPLQFPEPQRVDYSEDPIMLDENFRRDILIKIAEVGKELESVLGSAQDVEGCIDEKGQIVVVQTRPQM